MEHQAEHSTLAPSQLAHDMRGPLTAASTALYLLRRTASREALDAELLETAERSLQRLEQLIATHLEGR